MRRKTTPTQGQLYDPHRHMISECRRIIKDYYITQLDPSKRPKIFGMTASPVDAREDVIKAARSGG